ncbi:MAG: nucleotidyltransferase domain-containing protein [Candidatus Woesearchaeota archaeon]|nr:nucleotidyltransferase domain-containing protein [Candidatus Woesearchaeota archaeon]
MLFTKTQLKIMQVVCGKITVKHSIRQLANQLKIGYGITHTAVQRLLQCQLLTKDEHGLISLNYKEHSQELAYIESLRAEEFKRKYSDIALFTDKVIAQTLGFFILLAFGSYAKGAQKKDSDIDILMIIEQAKDAEAKERFLSNLADTYLKKAECRVIGLESVREMLTKRDRLNAMNETLNSHVLLFGSEAYYKLLQER